MSKIKVGDKVKVKRNTQGEIEWLSSGHTEGVFKVDIVDEGDGCIRFENKSLWYDGAWCTLATAINEKPTEEFDTEKVDISWFTERVKVGSRVARKDSLKLLTNIDNPPYTSHLVVSIDKCGFGTGCYWKYAVLEEDYKLFLEYMTLQEDLFNQRHLDYSLKRRSEQLQEAQEELAKKDKWYLNIPKKGVVCWSSDDVSETDSSCAPSVIMGYYESDLYPFGAAGVGWKYATPLTEQELMDNFISK